jgi:flagellar hook-basal body complex protein FliE
MIDTISLSSAALNALQAGSASGPASFSASGASGVSEAPFAGVLQGALAEMGKLEKDATSKVNGLLRGTGVDVHAAMIATERSDLAFEAALALRGKAVSAYEQLNSMQF